MHSINRMITHIFQYKISHNVLPIEILNCVKVILLILCELFIHKARAFIALFLMGVDLVIMVTTYFCTDTIALTM